MTKKALIKQLEDIEEFIVHIDASKGVKMLKMLIGKLKGDKERR